MAVSLIYRLDGPGHTGKGSNLTPAEVDQNFQDIETAIEDLENNSPIPVGIVEFTVDSATNTFMVYLSDGSNFGPFPLPIIAMKWQGEWDSGRSYNPNDLFIKDGDGIYVVLQPYEAPTEFDPDEINSSGLMLQKVFGLPSPTVIPVVQDETTTGIINITLDMLGQYRRVPVGAADAVAIMLPSDTTLNLPIGATITFRHAGDPTGTLEFVEDSGVTADYSDTLTFRKNGSTGTAIKTGANAWDVSGDMQVLEVPTA